MDERRDDIDDTNNMNDFEIARALGLDAAWLDAARQVWARIAREVAATEEIARSNSARVLAALSRVGLGDYHFGGTSGYGYDDTGREHLERAFAYVFGAEAALREYRWCRELTPWLPCSSVYCARGSAGVGMERLMTPWSL